MIMTAAAGLLDIKPHVPRSCNKCRQTSLDRPGMKGTGTLIDSGYGISSVRGGCHEWSGVTCHSCRISSEAAAWAWCAKFMKALRLDHLECIILYKAS